MSRAAALQIAVRYKTLSANQHRLEVFFHGHAHKNSFVCIKGSINAQMLYTLNADASSNGAKWESNVGDLQISNYSAIRSARPAD